jgi:hypothetical protein
MRSSACNRLGELNVIVVRERLIGAMGADRRRTGGDGAFAAGLLSGREDARVDAAMAAASKALSRFAKVGPSGDEPLSATSARRRICFLCNRYAPRAGFLVEIDHEAGRFDHAVERAHHP